MKNSKRRKWDSKLQMTFIYLFIFLPVCGGGRTQELMIISTQVWRREGRLLLHNLPKKDGRKEKWVSKQGFVLFTHIFTVIWFITANILQGNNPNWTSETRISAAWWLFYAVHVLIFIFYPNNKVWRTVRRKRKN